MNIQRSLQQAALCLTAFCALPVAHADLTFNFAPSGTFSGTAPAGSLSAVFHDVSSGMCGGASNVTGVCLTITSSLASGENLAANDALYLNFDPADSSNLGSLVFTLEANTGFSQAATVMTGEDAFKPDGDGQMDIELTYAPSTKAFTTGQSQTYLITGFAGLNAADFDFLSTCTTGCGTGAHLAAIHVQNTPSGGSGSAFVAGDVPSSVPEPTSIALFGTVVFGLSRVCARKLRPTA